MSEIDLKEQKKEDSDPEENKIDQSDNDTEDDDKKTEKNEGEEKEEHNNNKKADEKTTSGKKLKMGQRIRNFFQNPKKRLIFIISLGLLLIAIFGLGLYLMTHDKTKIEEPEKVTTAPPTEEKYPAVLNGIMTDQASANRHPLGVIIENHTDARPQSGLDQADVVYEAIAEGGITRFLAIYGTNQPEKVGPVRSARTYFVDWIHGYNGYLAHVGGNYDALEKIRSDGVLDLDQFRYSGPYWREKGLGVASEHTMFSSTIKLREQAEKNKYATANTFTVYKYKEDPTETLPEAQNVSIKFSGSSSSAYDVVFAYDKATNSYKRSQAGKPHTDRITKNQITPKNIATMTVDKKSTVTKINEQGYTMTTVGSGKARFYIDGQETIGTWKKESAASRELFYDASGTEIIFDRGQLWICIVSSDSTITVN